jgi:Cu/Zn superoxide dismutase
MNESANRLLAVMAALCAAACTVMGGAGLDDSENEAPGGPGGIAGDLIPLDSIAGGRVEPLTGYEGVGGRVQMARQLDGNTRVDVQFTGVTPGLEMTAHVHAAPCAYQGGGHYKIDPAVQDTLEENELWLHLLVSADGVASTSVTFAHAARGDAMSIVLHDPATGTKMACGDLLDDAAEGEIGLGGFFAPFSQAEEIDSGIGGAVRASRTPESTDITMTIGGLDDSQVYAAHVHALPCDVLDAGGHYKIDPTVVDTIAENEIWPDVSGIENGFLSSETSFAHALRSDAQSIVLHRVVGEAKPKVACADLMCFHGAPLVTAGDSVLVLGGQERAPDLWATAEMTRSLGGTTDAWLFAGGLAADTTYPVHVHNLPCSIKDGGGHYLIDPAAGAAEQNEMWLPLTTDGDGIGWSQTFVAHLARPEAQSLVIHDPADNARLACIDLE